jgi:uncharacterized membrane protein (TIGR02234 family)
VAGQDQQPDMNSGEAGMSSATEGHAGGRLAGAMRASSPRQELWLALLLGALGAGLIFLATRQTWAQIRTIPPKPLPASSVNVTGAALVSYADALVVAGLATLGAVLASRRLLRRLTGLLLAVIGLAMGAAAFTITKAAAVSAASSNISPETAAAGSVTDGSGGAPAVTPNVAGAAPHVAFTAAGWQAIVVIGAIAMVAAGVLVAVRAGRMAVMSGRYDSPAGAASQGQAAGQQAAGRQAGPGAESDLPDARRPVDSASLWESLSRGEDPTAAGSRPA